MGFLEKLGKTIDVWLSSDSEYDSKPKSESKSNYRSSGYKQGQYRSSKPESKNNYRSSAYKQEQYRSNKPEISSNKEKGDKFERYVVDIFNKQSKFFDIVDWTSDNCNKRKGIYIESDRNPDLRMRYKWKGKNEQFAVECKYRSGLHKNSRFNELMLHWSYPEKIKCYNNYSKKEDIPVFIVVGLGGKPENPAALFCIPLKDAKYPELFTSVFEKYEGNTEDPSFFWNGKSKSLKIK